VSGDRIELQGLGHRFRGARPLEVLAGIDLVVPAGAFLGLVGPSGCGKSTLLRMLAGLLRPTEGSATVAGESVVARPGHAAFMPQKDLLLPWRRALGNAVLGLEVDGVPAAAAAGRALPLFERFGLAGFEQAWPSELSGGMRQRLALLRTFLLPRGVLLLDEPFGALDAITRREMVDWLQEVWLADGRTVVFVTHDVEEALLLSDRVDVMSSRPGRIVASLDVPFARPRRPAMVVDPAFVALRGRVLDALEAG
jgi:ABC-type nitrate/sulfonate/bicarbonate transport system ATPase subunit